MIFKKIVFAFIGVLNAGTVFGMSQKKMSLKNREFFKKIIHDSAKEQDNHTHEIYETKCTPLTAEEKFERSVKYEYVFYRHLSTDEKEAKRNYWQTIMTPQEYVKFLKKLLFYMQLDNKRIIGPVNLRK